MSIRARDGHTDPPRDQASRWLVRTGVWMLTRRGAVGAPAAGWTRRFDRIAERLTDRTAEDLSTAARRLLAWRVFRVLGEPRSNEAADRRIEKRLRRRAEGLLRDMDGLRAEVPRALRRSLEILLREPRTPEQVWRVYDEVREALGLPPRRALMRPPLGGRARRMALLWARRILAVREDVDR